MRGLYNLNMINKSKLLKNPLLSRVVADLTCDGHLQIKEWRGLASFYTKQKEENQAIEKRYHTIFKIKGRVYPDKRKKETVYRIFFISKSLAIFLSDIGVPVGNKTNSTFTIPKWIYRGEEAIKKAYLRGVYDSEGCIYSTRQKNKPPRWRITIEMYKNEELKQEGENFMNQIKQLLLEFDIKSSPIRFRRGNIRKDGSKSIGMIFDIEKKSFRNFYKHVGFDSKSKKDKLNQAIARG